jgi:CheY-like chemotaxis protein
LNIVHRNGKHLLGLLNDILDLSKIEAGKLDLEIQPIKLMPFMTDVYSLMYTAAMDKNLHLNISGRGELPETIHTDPMRLRQVLLNLIGNAIKFTLEGFVNIVVSVIQNNDRPMLSFQVQDSGVGINASNINAIFKPFVQIKHSRAQTRTGTGLGLTISRQLVQHLGGDIHVTSQENLGSCFSFTIDPGNLAGVQYHVLSLQMDAEKPVLIPTTQFSGRILVVDDLRDIRALVGHYLRRCGLQVEYANNGLDAINKIQQAASDNNEFDLIFMDIHMPVKDGITAAKEIRALHYSCPLIALTAAHMKGDQDLYLESGFNASLSKPIDHAQMVRILGEFLRQPVEAIKSEGPKGVVRPAGESSNEAPHLSLTDRPILIAEDSPDALSALRQLLEMLGWSTITASDARNALNLANRIQPKYALVDIHLPDADGYTLSHDLETLIPDISIYICSGDEFDPSKTCNAIKGHFLKPIGLDQLKIFFTR